MARLIPLWGKHGLGKFAIVDDEDYERLRKIKWIAHAGIGGIIWPGYLFHKPGGKAYTIPMRHAILRASLDTQVEYKNRNGLDNQKANLRVFSATQED